MIKPFLVLIGLLIIHTTKASLDSLLPAQGKFENLSLVEQPAIYTGEELYSMIDGGAEIYFEYGFVQALDAAYTYNETNRFDIQLYEMADEGAAFGIFSTSVNKEDSIVDAGFIACLNNYYLMVCKGKYFFIISVNKSNIENSEILVSLGKHISDNVMQTTVLPSLITKFQKHLPKENNLKYFRGNIALSAIYFFNSSNIFELKEGICIEREDSKVFVLAYPPEKNLFELLDKIKEKISGNSKYNSINGIENGFSCIDRNGQKLCFTSLKNYLLITLGNTDITDIEMILKND